MKDRYNQLRRGRIGFQLEAAPTFYSTIEDWLLAYIKQLRNSLHGLLRYGILDGKSTEWTKGWTGYGIGDYRQRDVPIPMRTRKKETRGGAITPTRKWDLTKTIGEDLESIKQ